MTREFEPLGLHPQLIKAVADLGFTTPTPIQSTVIPLLLTGQDVIGQAQTGTGKTAAFGLPILQNLVPDQGFTQALILAPTRELAIQVTEAIEDYARYQQVRVLTVYGGQPYRFQIRELKRGVDIVVGTPGRILDLLKKGILDLANVHSLVLDEADEMLSMGFIEDIETILAAVPGERQTALFSATIPAPIQKLAAKYMHDPQTVKIEHKQRTVEAIEQRAYLVNHFDKPAALTRLFEVEAITSALVFSRTREGTGLLANELTVRGYPAEALNGDLSQDARERVLKRFRENKITVLVATDVAARGLDIDDISHVFNYDLPQFSELYVHRVGRTGRAGKTGVAISLVTPQDHRHLRRIENYTRQQIPLAQLPTEKEIRALRDARLVESVLVWLKRGRCKKEREMVEQLVETGYDPLEIAAITLKMARADEKKRPIHPISEVRPLKSKRKNRGVRRESGKRNSKIRLDNERLGSNRFKSNQSHEAGMVRLTLNAGKTHGLRPADVVGTIAYNADIPGRTIGAIKIRANHTIVDVPEQFVGKVLAKNGDYQVRKQRITIERATQS
jgi:ATP-dependent RNA helicase DeaD